MGRPDRFAALLEHTQDLVAVVDDGRVVRYVNPAVKRLLGYRPEEMVGSDVAAYVHPEDEQALQECFERVVGSDEPCVERAEYRYRAADDTWLWLESRVSNESADELGGYVVSARDVSERKAAEREHAETRRRLQQLADNAADVLWMFTADWTELLFVNPAFEDVYGLPRGDLLDDPTRFLDAIHPDDRPRVREAMARLSAGESVETEYRVDPSGDYQRWVWVSAEPIVDDGTVTRVVGFSRDVTDRRRRVQQLRVLDRLLRHNLRNDMTVVLGHADTLLDHEDPSVAERAARIRETGNELLETADKERDIVQVLSAAGDPVSLDLCTVVRDAVAVVGERHPDADVVVDAPDHLRVRACEDLDLAVVELVENAVEHAACDAPTVRVRVARAGDAGTLSVANAGDPISQFEFPDASPRDAEPLTHGTGLGLWLAYWVVDLSDGHLDFETNADGENVVRASLPRADS
jgi:PAS domain S-box-containing protein